MTGTRFSVSFSTLVWRDSLPSVVIRVCFEVRLPFSSIFLSHVGIFFSWACGPSSERWINC